MRKLSLGAPLAALLFLLHALVGCGTYDPNYKAPPPPPSKEEVFMSACTKAGTHGEECQAIWDLDDCIAWNNDRRICKSDFDMKIIKLRVRGIRIASDPVGQPVVVNPEAPRGNR